jgi:membrane-bound serine protease (ClpP class)
MCARLAHLSHLSPDVALLVLTLGLLLIYVELNRPGWVVSGAVGLLATLFAVASLGRMELNLGAIALVGTAVVLLALDLRQRTQGMVAVAATLALVLGFEYLVRGPAGMRMHTLTAVGCGVVLGVGTSILTRIARRARTNKGLD